MPKSDILTSLVGQLPASDLETLIAPLVSNDCLRKMIEYQGKRYGDSNSNSNSNLLLVAKDTILKARFKDLDPEAQKE